MRGIRLLGAYNGWGEERAVGCSCYRIGLGKPEIRDIGRPTGNLHGAGPVKTRQEKELMLEKKKPASAQPEIKAENSPNHQSFPQDGKINTLQAGL